MMRRSLNWVLCIAAVALVPLTALAAAEEAPPLWAYFQRGRPSEPPPAGPLSLPGSAKTYTAAQINDLRNPPDWYPDKHPPMPAVALHGHEAVLACASCHLVSGMGHQESSSLAALPAAYMVRQIEDMASGARHNPIMVDGKPQPNNVDAMTNIAKALSPTESEAAAAYFAALKPVAGWVKVVETVDAPKSFVNAGYVRVLEPGGGTEPLGRRIIELAQDEERQSRRDPTSGTIAYVPVGSVARGKALADSAACVACHGPGLTGVGEIPSIAGRSPVYLVRQLWAFKAGGRNGPQADLMKAAIAGHGEDDMIALAAYAASLKP